MTEKVPPDPWHKRLPLSVIFSVSMAGLALAYGYGQATSDIMHNTVLIDKTLKKVDALIVDTSSLKTGQDHTNKTLDRIVRHLDSNQIRGASNLQD